MMNEPFAGAVYSGLVEKRQAIFKGINPRLKPE